jgi:hypothetical protein
MNVSAQQDVPVQETRHDTGMNCLRQTYVTAISLFLSVVCFKYTASL